MTETLWDYKLSRAEQGAECAGRADLAAYLRRISADALSLRNGLGNAVTQVFAGTLLPDDLQGDLPFAADRVERLLFDDLMGAGVLVQDQDLATALRQTMRLLEETGHCAHLARSLFEQARDVAAAPAS
ncbi:hypothetical protein ACWC4D_34035 [Streptomyces sp. NPDC001288]|uniref:hypothetical protein n=1 Tax=unclassified Streptomyces TaxID=2593676 RepID=UPI003326B899